MFADYYLVRQAFGTARPHHPPPISLPIPSPPSFARGEVEGESLRGASSSVVLLGFALMSSCKLSLAAYGSLASLPFGSCVLVPLFIPRVGCFTLVPTWRCGCFFRLEAGELVSGVRGRFESQRVHWD